MSFDIQIKPRCQREKKHTGIKHGCACIATSVSPSLPPPHPPTPSFALSSSPLSLSTVYPSINTLYLSLSHTHSRILSLCKI